MYRHGRSAILLGALGLLGACASHAFAPGPETSAFDDQPDAAACRPVARAANRGFAFEADGSAKLLAVSTQGAVLGATAATAIGTTEDDSDCTEVRGWRVVDGLQPASVAAAGSANIQVPVYAQPLTASLAPARPTPRHALGIRLMPVPEEMAGWLHMDTPAGLLVLEVEPDGAASRAGLRGNDVLLTLAGAPVMTGEDISAALASVGPHGGVLAEIWRDGRPQAVGIKF